jgi:CDP-6-deoxy-D-xylo-4-hexulose-3-dehydrase
MQAAIGLSQLKKLDGFVAARRANWQRLYDGIMASPLLKQHLTPVVATEGTTPSWFGFPMFASDALDREKLVSFLEEHKVGTRLVFGGDLTKQPAYAGERYRVHGSLTNTTHVMHKAFWVGVHPALDSARITYMLEQLEAAVRAQL